MRPSDKKFVLKGNHDKKLDELKRLKKRKTETYTDFGTRIIKFKNDLIKMAKYKDEDNKYEGKPYYRRSFNQGYQNSGGTRTFYRGGYNQMNTPNRNLTETITTIEGGKHTGETRTIEGIIITLTIGAITNTKIQEDQDPKAI